MASKRSDVELRVSSRAGNARKDLAELNTELDKLVENQREQAQSSVLATRSLKQLSAEQQALSRIASELSRREGLIEKLIGKQSEVTAAKNNINRIRQELAELLQIRGNRTFLGDIDAPIKRVRAELAAAERLFNKTAGGADKLGESLSEIGVDTTDLAGSLRSVTGSLERAQGATRQQVADIERLDRAQEEAAASARKLREAQRFVAEQQNRRQDRRADAVAGFAGIEGYQRQAAAAAAATAAQERQAAAAQRVVGINERFQAVLARNAAAQAAYARQTQAAAAAGGRAASTIRGKTNATERNTAAVRQNASALALFNDVGRKSLSTYQRLRGELLSMVVAYGGLFQAVNTVTQALQVSQQRAAINAKLLAATGNDTRRAAQAQTFLREEAERLGFVFDDLAKYYANFAIAGRANGLTTAQVNRSFSQAATILKGLALSTADADGAFRAFEQIMSKSRVTAEELRGQLGERIPGVVKAFGDALGLTVKEVDDYLREGRGTIADFLKLLEAQAAQYEEAARLQSLTVFSDINRLRTAYNDFLQLFIEGEASEELRTVVNQLTEMLKGAEGKAFAQALGSAFADLLRVLQFVIANFETLIALAKLAFAVLAAKAVTDVIMSFWAFGSGVLAVGRGLLVYTRNARAAAAAGTALTAVQRGLLLLLGPAGVAVAALATGLYALGRAYFEAEKRAKDFAAAADAAFESKTAAQAQDSLPGLRESLEAAEARLARLREMQEESGRTGFISPATTTALRTVAGLVGVTPLEDAVKLEEARVASARTLLRLAQRKVEVFGEQEAAADALAAKEEQAAADAAKRALEADAAREAARKAAADAAKRDAEDERKRKAAQAAEDARANAQRALQRTILDLDQQIFDARIDGEARTVAQIEENYQLSLAQIEAKLAELNLGIDAERQRASTVGGAGGISAADLALVDAARQRVELFGQALRAQAATLAQTTKITLAEKNINNLIAERDAKIAASNALVEAGVRTEVEGRRAALALQQQYAPLIIQNVNELILAFERLRTENPDLFASLGGDRFLAGMQQLRTEASLMKTEFQLIGENIGGQLAQGAANAFGVLAEGLANAISGAGSLGDAFRSAGDAVLNFVADFLVNIGKAIIQALILRAIMNAINNKSGGYTDAVFGVLGGSNHDGGIVGQDGKARWMPADAFKRAKRFHEGGLPGLRPNEVPTILERGEEVLTAGDPRHVSNGGKNGAAVPNTTIINTIDAPSVVEAGLASKVGTRVLVNAIQANRQQIRTALGV
ncbi:MAG: hypothetical protein DDT26_00295 [Dehalococcoidia bacterium]|nr:hypothetical protein [Chloroflexota bacterium]